MMPQTFSKSHRPLKGQPVHGFAFALVIAIGVTLLASAGCRITNIDSARRFAKIASIGSEPIVDVQRKKRVRVAGPFQRFVVGRPIPSQRTQLFLRKNNLFHGYETDPNAVVENLHRDCRCEPNMESVHAIAELSQLEADWSLRTRNQRDAAKFYATAVIHAYQFLFDQKLNLVRNAYDPQFREICDIYNHSLENLLRLVCKSEAFYPGQVHRVGDEKFGVEFEVVLEARWQEEEFERFELVNDYEVKGLDNQYHTYGLGVPLIAIRKAAPDSASPAEKYYPPSLALPLTAFCEVLEFDNGQDKSNLRAVLKLYDPLEKTVVKTETRVAPLESNLTLPLAYYLNDPLLKTDLLSTVSLLDANVANEYFGFYMLEPFNPDKIPVVMVHGLWSNPVTWTKMFNDLRSNEWIRDHYQFWFYMYPTGQPFGVSSQQMRTDLAQLRQDFDPLSQSKTLNEMILVGHSMGGLISKMQTIDSGDHFWNIICDRPIEEVKGEAATINRVRDLLYFEANPAIKSVITIASPHRGSEYANTATRWLSHQFFRLPKMLTDSFDEFVAANQDILKNANQLTTATSVDSLSPNSPFIQKLTEIEPNPGVKFHNIIGNMDCSKFFGSISNCTPGDGVVSVESAKCPGASSEIEVPSEHMEVHQHPEAILEVKRILIENLVITNRIDLPDEDIVRQVSFESEIKDGK